MEPLLQASPLAKLRLKEQPLSAVLPLAVQREESLEGHTKAVKHSSLEVTLSLPLLPGWPYPVYSLQPLGTSDQAMQLSMGQEGRKEEIL